MTFPLSAIFFFRFACNCLNVLDLNRDLSGVICSVRPGMLSEYRLVLKLTTVLLGKTQTEEEKSCK